jgi:hypothetical protein
MHKWDGDVSYMDFARNYTSQELPDISLSARFMLSRDSD